MDSEFFSECLLPLLIMAVTLAVFVLPVMLLVRRANAYQAALETLRNSTQPLALIHDGMGGIRGELVTLNGGKPLYLRRVVLGLQADSLVIYSARPPLPEVLRLPLAQVRWYGRPQKYHSGRNAIWLHFETPDGWQLLKLDIQRGSMTDFVRALKTVTPPELVTAYRRRRPYIHVEPLAAHPATQDLYGAWTLAAPQTLYLMPRALVLLEQNGTRVLRTFPLDQLADVTALRRMDAPDENGLLRFTMGGEVLAFSVEEAEGMAAQVAQAARLNLETPLWPKQKDKSDDEWEWEDE